MKLADHVVDLYEKIAELGKINICELIEPTYWKEVNGPAQIEIDKKTKGK